MLLKTGLSVQGLIEQMKKTFARFPLAIVSAIAATVFAIWIVEDVHSANKDHALFTLLLGIPLFVSISLFRESRNLVSAAALVAEALVGILFLSLHYFLSRDNYTDSYFLKYVQMSLILHLAVSFIGFIGQHKSSLFWQFNRRIFLRILLSALYASVFWVGLAIALFTSSKLFEFQFRDHTYLDLWIISAVLLQTWHFLAGVPKVDELTDETPYPQGLRVFVQFLLIPLVSLYMVILYTYMAKILVLRDWPKGYLGWLVSVMAVLGVFNLLLIDPERQRKDSRWIASYSKAFYVLIIPLLLMLFVAIGKRVSAYGLTEIRYFLILLPSLLFAFALYFIFSAKKKIEVIPISLCIVSFLSLFGPWSAYNVAFRSQEDRAVEILNRNHLLENGRLVKSTTPVSHEDRAELTSIFSYLIAWQGPERIKEWLTPEQYKRMHTDLISATQHQGLTASELIRELQLNPAELAEPKKPAKAVVSENRAFTLDSDFEKIAVDLSGYRLAVPINFNECLERCKKDFQRDGRMLTVSQSLNPPKLEIQDGAKVIISFKEEDLLMKLVGDELQAKGDDPIYEAFTLKVMTLESEGRAKLYIQSLNGRFAKGRPFVHSLTGLVLLK